jgi:hypothetical protein
LPSLSSNGTKIFISKDASGEILICELLFGERYGSDGLTTTEFAIGVLGGKLNTEYFVLSTKAAAIVARSVVMAAGIAILLARSARDTEQ